MASFKKLVPLLDRILVERVAARTKTAGGVLLPDSAASKMNEGKVIAVGAGRRDKDGKPIPVGVAPGDRVLLPEYGGQAVKVQDKELFIYRDEEIVGILKDE